VARRRGAAAVAARRRSVTSKVDAAAVAWSLMSDQMARRAWLMPPACGVVDGIDLSLLDPADEGERQFLLLSEHPELAEAIENEEEREVESGAMSPRLHLAMHEVVANRLWDDDPPEMWRTAQRLTQAGYERHDVLHMLSSVVGTEVYNALTGNATSDIADTRRALAALPDSWEALRAVPQNRAARRAQARRQQK